MNGSSIPELLGFAPVPYDREKRYSVLSYQAMYRLTEEEAREVRDTCPSHPAIDMHLAQRYMSDSEYRARVDSERKDLTATEPDVETKRLMRRLSASMKAPTQEAGRAVERVIGELPEDKDGAA